MKQTFARIIKPYTQGNLFRQNPNLISSSICLSPQKLRLFTSKSHDVVKYQQQSSAEQNKQEPIDDDDDDADVSNTELKKSVERFMKGDEEAIPSIFQAILERKLAGKGEESDDDELMKELSDVLPPVDDDVSREKEFDSSDDD